MFTPNIAKGGDETRSWYVLFVQGIQPNYMQVLHAGMVYITLWYMHVPRSVLEVHAHTIELYIG